MAYEQINRYVDRLAERYKKIYENNQSDIKTSFEILLCLVDLYDTILQNPKFKSQKRYCKNMIYKCNLAFAQGYFKEKNPIEHICHSDEKSIFNAMQGGSEQ